MLRGGAPLSSRAALLNRGTQKRKMGDWFKPNYWVEEWSSKRETTEFSFEFNEKTLFWIILCYVAIPVGIHHMIKKEFDELPNTTTQSKKMKELSKL